MKTHRLTVAILLVLTVADVAPVSAQSFNRIRRSLDRATGGQTAAPVRQVPVPAAPTLTPEQAAAAKAAEVKRQKAAAAAEDKVVPFLRERVEGGSADAAYDLAQRYEEGRGVKVDPEEARRLYKLSDEGGNEAAKKWLKENPEPKPSPGAKAAAATPAVAPATTPAKKAPAK